MPWYRAFNEGIQGADSRINFKVRTALACSQGVVKPVKMISLNIQKKGKYRRDGRGWMSSISAVNRTFFPWGYRRRSEDVSEHEVHTTSTSIIFGTQTAASPAIRGKGRYGTRSLNRVVKICDHREVNGKGNWPEADKSLVGECKWLIRGWRPLEVPGTKNSGAWFSIKIRLIARFVWWKHRHNC